MTAFSRPTRTALVEVLSTDAAANDEPEPGDLTPEDVEEEVRRIEGDLAVDAKKNSDRWHNERMDAAWQQERRANQIRGGI